jgi:hypothetical protein
MAVKPKPDPNAELHRTLKNACLKWGARENSVAIFAEAVTEPLDSRSPDRPSPGDRKDTRGHPGWRTHLTDMESFNDQLIARGVADTATDAIKSMWPSQWRAPTSG